MRSLCLVLAMLASGCATDRPLSGNEMSRIEDLARQTARSRDRFLEATGRAISDLHAGRCARAFDRLGVDPDAPEKAPGFWGDLYRVGLCVPKDPVKSAFLFQRAVRANPFDGEILAKLGAAYWLGDGVAKDPGQARRLFHEATLAAGSGLLERMANGTFVREQAFSNAITGPWAYPCPLARQLEWLQGIARSGGKAITEIGLGLFRSANPKQKRLALRWLQTASLSYNDPAAFFHLGVWRRDPRFYTLFNPRTGAGLSHEEMKDRGTWDLLSAAERAYLPAQKAVVELLYQIRASRERNRALYYWLLQISKDEEPVPDDELEKAASALSPQERHWIENWQEPSPITPPNSPFVPGLFSTYESSP